MDRTKVSAMRKYPLFLALLFAPTSSALALEFEESVIEGEVQKPEVTVVISRQNLNSKFIVELKESFLQKIIESVEEPPF